MKKFDVIVIGGGHNGLVSSIYLAKAGLKVGLLEQKNKLGGLCNSEEILPGHFVSVGADVYGMLRPQIVADLQLSKFGLDVYPMNPQLFMPFPDGNHISLWQSYEKTIEEISKYSLNDAQAFKEFSDFTDRAAGIIGNHLLNPPPTWSELRSLFKQQCILDSYDLMLHGTIAQVLDEFFESDYIKAPLMLASLFFRSAGPRELGTVLAHFITANHTVGNSKNTAGYVRGGMVEIINALRRAALNSGVEIITNSRVMEILLNDNKVSGVINTKGQTYYSEKVLSCVDIKKTFLNLIDPINLPNNFLDKIKNLKAAGNHTRIIAVVDKLPHFSCLNSNDQKRAHTGYIAIAPSIDYAQQAWESAKRNEIVTDPIIGISIQSATDPSITDSNYHVMSIYVLFTPYIQNHPNLDRVRTQVTNITFNTIEKYAPGFKDSIVTSRTYTPMDFEIYYGATEGGCDQIEMNVDQMFSARPLPEWNDYTTPVNGLYLGGAGTHPGGSVSGAPGYNSAHAILTQLGLA